LHRIAPGDGDPLQLGGSYHLGHAGRAMVGPHEDDPARADGVLHPEECAAALHQSRAHDFHIVSAGANRPRKQGKMARAALAWKESDSDRVKKPAGGANPLRLETWKSVCASSSSLPFARCPRGRRTSPSPAPDASERAAIQTTKTRPRSDRTSWC